RSRRSLTWMSLATARTPRTRFAARSAASFPAYESTKPVSVTAPLLAVTAMPLASTSESQASCCRMASRIRRSVYVSVAVVIRTCLGIGYRETRAMAEAAVRRWTSHRPLERPRNFSAREESSRLFRRGPNARGRRGGRLPAPSLLERLLRAPEVRGHAVARPVQNRGADDETQQPAQPVHPGPVHVDQEEPGRIGSPRIVDRHAQFERCMDRDHQRQGNRAAPPSHRDGAHEVGGRSARGRKSITRSAWTSQSTRSSLTMR